MGKKAEEKRNWDQAERLKENKPKYSLDHIVRERYPTFIDAIRDLEDCLCLVFLYSTFPRTARTPVEMVDLCKRLSIEFMHYVIETRSLRKVFCSIKGYYFQADIKGQTVTWIVPHNFGHQAPAAIDMKLMSVFVEFYTTMLGFINFRLYNGINLTYPPKLAGVDATNETEGDDRVYALNQSLHRTVLPEETPELDVIPMTDDSEALEAARKEAEATETQSKLFAGLKFFLGREVPREPLVFMLRCVGGEVSWDATAAPGATFNEEDDKVTHQISDRPALSNKKLGRFYVQPQWIFDSINMRTKLNEKDYALGETLPAHLSPFVVERRPGDYIPPEEKAMLEMMEKQKEGKASDDDEDEDEEDGQEEENGEEEEDDDEGDEDVEDEESEEEEEDEEEDEVKDAVKEGKKEVVDKKQEKLNQEKEEYRLREMMVPRKHRGLYKSMMKNRKKRTNEAKYLTKKREKWESENPDAMPGSGKKKRKGEIVPVSASKKKKTVA